MPWDDLVAQFKDGDILYGLNDGRSAARDAILADRNRITERVKFMCCFTRRVNYDRIVIQNSITDSVFDPAKPGLQTNAQILGTKSVKSDPQRAVGFKDFLNDHGKYSIADYKPGVSPVAAWLKTSKAGLEYQATRRHSMIHFVLDGLNYDRVLLLESDKSTGGLARSKLKLPLDITCGEIRFLFRRRSEPDYIKYVQFWLAGQQVDPPWLWKETRYKFANFLYTKDQILADEEDSTDFKRVIQELKAALVLQRAFRKKKGKYRVREGDDFASIAKNAGMPWAKILLLNPDAAQLRVGQILSLQP